MGKLEGKVAIVTGSGQGIGRGIAVGLAREGAKVVTNNRKPGSLSVSAYDKDSMPEEDYQEMMGLAGDAESTAKQIIDEGGTAIPVYGDVAVLEDAQKLVQTAIDHWGRVDIVVNNAGGTGSGALLQLDDATWDKLTLAKTKGAFHLMKLAVPYMMKQKFGRIFNCASDAWIGLPGNDAYSCGNAGAVGLTWAAAKELYRFGITVNAYCPQGASPAHAVEYRKMLRQVRQMTGQDPNPALLRQVEADHGDPSNLGPIFAYLSTEEASDISGEVFALKSSGTIERYSFPKVCARVTRPEEEGALWSVDELADVVRKELLGPDYKSPASVQMWQ